MNKFKAGFVTLIGKPNVGKSTLLNKLVGEKIAIISSHPQTTRNIIKGIVTFEEAQIIFLDTPGIVKVSQAKTPIDKKVIERAFKTLEGVDVAAFMAGPEKASPEDIFVINNLKGLKNPVLLIINKIDKIKKSLLEPLIKSYRDIFPFKQIIPISAKNGTNLSILVGELIRYLPVHPPYYPSDLFTDQAENILVAELIREKVFALTHQEVPYSVLVKVKQFEERKKDLIYINAAIYTEYSSQKGILIGKSGGMIKEIGKLARKDIEERLGCRVYLDLRVGVKKKWRKRKESLRELEYGM